MNKSILLYHKCMTN